jgi:hypothetical protein
MKLRELLHKYLKPTDEEASAEFLKDMDELDLGSLE